MLPGLLALVLAGPAAAHPGAPYLIAVEEAVGPYQVTAWADPDTGEGTFLVDLHGAASPRPIVRVRPLDGHRGAAEYPAAPEQGREGLRYVARVPFDAVGPWEVLLRIEGPAGRGELARRVEVTPPGMEWWQTALLAVPFLALAGLWLLGLRRQAAEAAGEPPPATEG